MTIRLLPLLFIVLLMAQSSTAQYEHLAASNIDEALLKKAYSVVRYDDVEVTFSKGVADYDYSFAITVLDAKHADKLHVRVPYRESNSKVTNVQIRYLDGEGKELKKVKKKEIEDQYSHSYEVISQSRFLHYQYYTESYPVTLVYSFHKEEKDVTLLDPWYPLPGFNTAVETSSYTIVEQDEAISPRYVNTDRYGISPMKENVLRLTSLAPITKEKLMPSRREVLPMVYFYPEVIRYFDHRVTATSWEDLSAWMYEEMFVPQSMADLSALKPALDQYIGDTTDKLQVARKLYAYVTNNSRYVAITLDDGGYVPLSVETVHEKKYGDCKALSFYYQSLASLYDLECDLAFIYAGNSKLHVSADYLSPTYFNHVINRLTVAGQEYWVDCTSTKNPFDFVGSSNESRDVLLAGGAKTGLWQSPSYEYKQESFATYELNEEGVLSGKYELASKGSPISSKLFIPDYTEKELKEYQEDFLFDNYRDVTVVSADFEVDSLNRLFTESYEIKAPHQLEKLGDYRLLKLNRHELPVPKLKKDKKRVWDVVIGHTKAFDFVEEVVTPLSMVPAAEPDVSYESKYGKYDFTTEASAGKIVIRRQLTLNEGRYPPEEYNEIKRFFDKIRKVEKSKINYTLKS